MHRICVLVDERLGEQPSVPPLILTALLPAAQDLAVALHEFVEKDNKSALTDAVTNVLKVRRAGLRGVWVHAHAWVHLTLHGAQIFYQAAAANAQTLLALMAFPSIVCHTCP